VADDASFGGSPLPPVAPTVGCGRALITTPVTRIRKKGAPGGAARDPSLPPWSGTRKNYARTSRPPAPNPARSERELARLKRFPSGGGFTLIHPRGTRLEAPGRSSRNRLHQIEHRELERHRLPLLQAMGVQTERTMFEPALLRKDSDRVDAPGRRLARVEIRPFESSIGRTKPK
jgi:hypothetical protein